MQAKDAKCRTAIAARLSRAEGQMRGIRKMMEEERDCVDILRQLAAIDGAIRAAARMIVAKHLESCMDRAAESEKDRVRIMQELNDIFARFS
jgi:DNA-binding FrmR family transcriptional regulator